MKTFIITFAAVLLSVLTLKAEKTTLTILHVNDTHSCLSPGAPRDASLNGKIGGIAKAATVIGMVRQADPDAMVFHPGDMFVGDLFFNKYFGAAEFGLMKQLGFTAMGLGNHEFDLGPEALLMALKEGFGAEPLPILSANISCDDENLSPLTDLISPYIIKEVKGIKIGIFGITSPAAMELSDPDPILISDDMESILPAVITEMKMAGAEIIIMLSGLGEQYEVPLAEAIPYIDIIIGGDNHYVYDKPLKVNNPGGSSTYIVQAGPFYRNIGKFEIEYDNGISNVKWENIALDETIPEFPDVKAYVDQLISGIEETYGPVYTSQLTSASETFIEEMTSDALSKKGEKDTPVGNLVCEAFLAAFPNADVAIEPGGSTAQPIYAGAVTPDDIYRTISYGFNTDNGLGFRMATFDATGATLAAGLELGLSMIEQDDEFLIQCAGMSYNYDASKNEFNRLTMVLIDGEPLNPEATYTIVTNEFVPMVFSAMGFELSNITIHEGLSEFQVVSGYLQNMSEITPVQDGRIYSEKTIGVGKRKNNSKKGVNDVKVSPNPCSETLEISIDTDLSCSSKVKIYANNGQSIYQIEIPAGSNINESIDISDLSTGLYFVIVKNGSKVRTATFSIVR